MMMLRTIMFLWMACTTIGRPAKTAIEQNDSLTPPQALALFLLSGDTSGAFSPSTLVNPFPAAGLGKSSVRSSPKAFQAIARRATLTGRASLSRMSDEAPAEEAAAPEAPAEAPAEEAAKATIARTALADIKEGSEFVGKIKAVQPYGLFVDFGAKTDGLMHVSQLPESDTSSYSEGDSIEGIVDKVDIEGKKVSLGTKAAAKLSLDELTIGMEFEGTIRSTMSYGAFVDIGATSDGLLHVSELSSEGKFVEDAAELVSPGDKIKCRIRAINYDRQQVSLTCREAQAQQRQPARAGSSQNTELLQKYADKDAKDKIEGKVVSVVSFGAFVELEPGAQGLVHISELADQRVELVDEVVSIGDLVQVRVKGVDTEKGQIALSMKTYNEETAKAEAKRAQPRKDTYDPLDFGDDFVEDDGLPWDEPLDVHDFGVHSFIGDAIREAKRESTIKVARKKDKSVRFYEDQPMPLMYAASKADSY